MAEMFTLHECRTAIAALDRLAEQAESRALKAYWQGVQDTWKARERAVERASLLGQTPQRVRACPRPILWGMDQKRCEDCGLIWDRSEERPDCMYLEWEL